MVQKMEILLKPFLGLKYLQVSLPQWFRRTEIYCPQTHILMNPRENNIFEDLVSLVSHLYGGWSQDASSIELVRYKEM